MYLDVWCETDTGLSRSSNQDSFLVDESLGLYIVADGMGGHKGGEVASNIAVKTAKEFLQEQKTSRLAPEELLQAVYKEVNQRIFTKSQEVAELKGMGTTMVLCYVMRDTVYIGNVGDSRVYLSSNGNFWQVTEDHSLVNQQVKAGVLSVENIKSYSGRNIITRSVGYEANVSCDIYKRKLIVDEKYLICSDGLTGMVDDEVLSHIVNDLSCKAGVEKCIKEAKANGGEDNITALILQVKSS